MEDVMMWGWIKNHQLLFLDKLVWRYNQARRKFYESRERVRNERERIKSKHVHR